MSYGTISTSIAKTRDYAVSEGFKFICPHDYNLLEKQAPWTLNLDWLQLGVVFSDGVSGLDLGNDFNRGAYRYICRPIGDKHYKYVYDIYKGNTLFYVAEICPRNKDTKEPNSGLLKVENWLLYQDWHKELMGFIATNVKVVERISRVDIALDGVNSIYDLMCDYASGKTDGYCVKMIGKSNVTGHEINRLTRRPKGFSIGSKKGQKQIAIYNKTADIKRTSKNYIKEFWARNGMDLTEDHYRFELRLKNTYLRDLRRAPLADFDPMVFLDDLRYDFFKLDVLHTACQYFFEFVYMDDTNVTRCTRVGLMPPIPRDIVRVAKVYNGTAYKAKMQVHNTFFQVAKSIVGIEEGIAIIDKQLETYDLYDWFAVRMHDFSKRYRIENENDCYRLFKCSVPKTPDAERAIRRRIYDLYCAKHAKQMTFAQFEASFRRVNS